LVTDFDGFLLFIRMVFGKFSLILKKSFSMKKLSFLFILILLASCKTSFRISVQEPSFVRLPSSANTVGIMNNTDNTNSPAQVLDIVLKGEQFNGNLVASERAVEGVLRALGNSNQLTGVSIANETLKGANGGVDWNKVDSIARARNLQVIFEIESLKTVSPVGGSVVAGATGKTSTQLTGTALVNVYVAESHQAFEQITLRKSYNIPVPETTNILDILNDGQKRKDYYRALGYELGYKGGKLIYPNWVWVNRKFYNKGSKEIKRAKPMIYKGNWDIAEKQLLIALERGNKEKELGRATFNLALVKEGQGYIDEAVIYCEKAALEYGVKMANEYLVQLRKRQRQIALMNAAD